MKTAKIILLLSSMIFLLGCATPGAVEHDSKVAWEGTKKASGEAWDGTKKVSNEAWQDTKQVSGEAWDSTKQAVNTATD